MEHLKKLLSKEREKNKELMDAAKAVLDSQAQGHQPSFARNIS